MRVSDKLAEKLKVELLSLTSTVNPNIYKGGTTQTLFKNITPTPIVNTGLLGASPSISAFIGKASSLSSLYSERLVSSQCHNTKV